MVFFERLVCFFFRLGIPEIPEIPGIPGIPEIPGIPGIRLLPCRARSELPSQNIVLEKRTSFF